MPKRRTRRTSVPVRFALANEKMRRRFGRAAVYGKRSATLLVGAALSLGGVTEAFNDVHFLVRKDLDRVQVVRQSAKGEAVVARIAPTFLGNSLFKISNVLPDRYVTREMNLFDNTWIQAKQETVADFEIINDAIREQFFKTIPFGDLIHEKAAKYDVDPALVAAVMEAESRFKRKARSPVGAKGLMQLMPRTGAWMGARDLYDADQNVDAGVKYLKYLEKRFPGDQKKVIAAYNAGEGTVRRYRGVPPYRETRTYVKKVMNNYEKRNRELKEFGDAAGR